MFVGVKARASQSLCDDIVLGEGQIFAALKLACIWSPERFIHNCFFPIY